MDYPREIKMCVNEISPYGKRGEGAFPKCESENQLHASLGEGAFHKDS